MTHASPIQRSSKPPKAVVVVRPDTMGDLVLFAPVLARMKASWPSAKVAVVIRESYLDLAKLLVPGIEWIATDINPFSQRPAQAMSEVERLRKKVADFAPELLIAACPQRHWLDSALAAAAPSARTVAFLSNGEDPYFGLQVKQVLGEANVAGFRETASAGSGETDWERNHGLADYLLGRSEKKEAPSLSLGPELLSRADLLLAKLGLGKGSFVACAAAGFANVRIKTWPAERFASTLAWLRKERSLPALLVGQTGEKTYLEAIASASGASLWIGGEGDLPLLAGLLARSSLYFGNDTGAMHLAGAVGRPVLGLFGGGTWPRFKPAAARSISVVNPLPCFGCGWDCPFGDAPCVQAVCEEDARKALSELLAPGTQRGATVHSVSHIPEVVATFMGRTAALAKERTAAHLARERKLEETAFLAGEKDGEIESLKAAADEKDGEIESLKAATNEKDAEIESKDVEITALKAATNEKDAEIESKDVEIKSLKTAANEKDAEIAGLAKACAERLELIIRLDGDVKRYVAQIQAGEK